MSTPSWISIVSLVAFGLGYWAGYSEEAEKFEQFRSKVAAQAAVAKAKNEELVKRHEQTAQLIEQTYQAELDLLDDYYHRLLDDRPSGTGVPAVPQAPRRADGAACPKPVPVVTKECAETALKLKELQAWILSVSN